MSKNPEFRLKCIYCHYLHPIPPNALWPSVEMPGSCQFLQVVALCILRSRLSNGAGSNFPFFWPSSQNFAFFEKRHPRGGILGGKKFI